MKLTTILMSVLAMVLLSFSGLAFAQVTEVGDSELIIGILAMVQGAKGLKTMAIVGVAIQALLLFTRHKWSNFLGKSKITIISVLSFAGIIIAGLAQGLGVSEIIGDGATLAAFQVFINQIFKQFSKEY